MNHRLWAILKKFLLFSITLFHFLSLLERATLRQHVSDAIPIVVLIVCSEKALKSAPT
jgi:hypothetical protein